jgi:hypothetical protein
MRSSKVKTDLIPDISIMIYDKAPAIHPLPSLEHLKSNIFV